MIGLDTTAVIDLFKGVDAVKQVLSKTGEPLCATRVTYLELMFGIDPRRHKEEEQFYDAFFSTIYALELDASACKQAGRIFQELKQKGRTVGEFDCVIAGILLNNGIKKIITRNKKHFENTGLTVVHY